ncbi:hypothetical protein A3K63_05100 [Candidatus Micrarchaeota archaeon RBG_16_49_10]|nr:MAG: hypothetical protein A3K63_05100 [Candidatus Micrarchaeota archaeon RBG_16_49_10]
MAESFYKALESYFPTNEIALPRSPSILNIGCGLSRESGALRQYFPGCRITGADSGSNAKGNLAVQAHREGLIDTPYEGNALAVLYGGFDAFVARHPNVQMTPGSDYVTEQTVEAWREVFGALKGVLTPNKCLIVTTTNKPEMSSVQGFLGKGLRIWGPRKNEYSTPLNLAPGWKYLEKGNGQDHHILFASGKY